MPSWAIIVAAVCGIFLVRGLAFLYLWRKANRLRDTFDRYWKKEIPYEKAGQEARSAVGLFRAARIVDAGLDVFRPAPYGGVVQHSTGVFRNLFVRRQEVMDNVESFFLEAIGYFKAEARRSFIPIFWPSVLFNLPSDLLAYIGVSPENAIARTANVVVAVAEAATGIYGLVRLLA
jgi:hypothetical protein